MILFFPSFDSSTVCLGPGGVWPAGSKAEPERLLPPRGPGRGGAGVGWGGGRELSAVYSHRNVGGVAGGRAASSEGSL